MPLSERLREIEQRHAGEPTPDITEPTRSPELDAPTDTPHGVTEAEAIISARLPIKRTDRYTHTDDGKYVDTATGEVLDSLPTG